MTPEAETLSAKIGLRLRAARKDQKLSLQTLATMTGGILSKSRISNHEQGLRRIGIEEARLLAKALGTVSATYLLCLDVEDALNEQEQDLVKWFRQTDQRGRETIFDIAQFEAGDRSGA